MLRRFKTMFPFRNLERQPFSLSRVFDSRDQLNHVKGMGGAGGKKAK